MDCLYCKIINNELPSKKLYEDEHVLVILDINPVTAGHLLVLPKKHFDMFENANNEYLEKTIIITRDIAKKVKEILGSKGFNVMINNGQTAGQVINHLHIHVVQRFGNDTLDLWKTDENEKQKLEETYKKIISNIN